MHLGDCLAQALYIEGHQGKSRDVQNICGTGWIWEASIGHRGNTRDVLHIISGTGWMLYIPVGVVGPGRQA